MKRQRKKGPILLILLLILLAGMGFLGYHLLNIKTIEVKGNESRRADYIIGLSGVQSGTNILKVDEESVRNGIEADPYLKFVSMARVLPDRIVIEVQERKAAARIGQSTQLLIDEEGFVLEIVDDPDAYTLPVVSGMDVSNFKTGKQIGFLDKAQQAALLGVLRALAQSGLQESAAEIDLLNTSDIKMRTRSGIDVDFGRFENMDKKFRWLKEVLLYLEDEGITEGSIDLSSGTSATFKEKR